MIKKGKTIYFPKKKKNISKEGNDQQYSPPIRKNFYVFCHLSSLPNVVYVKGDFPGLDKIDDYFESVYREFYPDIYRFAFSYVKRKEVAEDIAQDIFLEFYFHAPKDSRNIKSFLLKTTRNRCLDIIRKEKRTNEAQRQYETMRSQDGKRAELSENEDIILLSLSKIPKKYQEPIRFFYYGDMTVKEIASLLFISEEAVRKRLQRGREYLKTLLEGEKENDNR